MSLPVGDLNVKRKKIVKFILGGILTNLIHYLFFLVYLNFVFVDTIWLAAYFAYFSALAVAYYLNKVLVFKDNSVGISHLKSALKYFGYYFISGSIQSIGTVFFANMFNNPHIGWLIAAVSLTAINYIVLDRFVFTENSNKRN